MEWVAPGGAHQTMYVNMCGFLLAAWRVCSSTGVELHGGGGWKLTCPRLYELVCMIPLSLSEKKAS
jgi:hypothetical protein